MNNYFPSFILPKKQMGTEPNIFAPRPSGPVLKTVKVCLPTSEVVERFTNTVDSIFKRQDMLEQENQQLTQLRDWLLPMLMNGQVTVA